MVDVEENLRWDPDWVVDSRRDSLADLREDMQGEPVRMAVRRPAQGIARGAASEFAGTMVRQVHGEL